MDRRSFLAGAVAVGAAAFARADEVAKSGTVRIAHVGDPQFGFGCWALPADQRAAHREEYYAIDLARTEKMIESVNSEKPDLVIIAGDMTNYAEDLKRDWPRLLKKFKVPVIAVPGNHDMGNNATRANYDRFVSVFGTDHQTRTLGNFRIIAANSQFSRETNELKQEQREHNDWFFDELAAAHGKGLVPIVATHIGPFVHSRGEADNYESYPKNGFREKVLKACDEAGTKFWLGGHTHAAYLHMYRGMTVLNAQSLCHNFDSSPYAWRLLSIDPRGDWSWNLREV